MNSIFDDDYEFPYLLIIQEHFSKFCTAYPLRNKAAKTVLKKIKNFFLIIKIIGGDTIQVKIGKDYLNFDLKKNEEYLVSSFQLRKCNEQAWDNLVNSK